MAIVELKADDVLDQGGGQPTGTPGIIELSPDDQLDREKPMSGAGGGYEPTEDDIKTGMAGQELDRMSANAESIARIIGGGLSKLVRGVITTPLDIAGQLGSDKADKFANIIRGAIPQIPAESTAEEIGQVLVQYGLPATAAIKVVGGVLAGAPGIVKFAGQIIGAGVTDIIASDPTDVSTLGDWVGGPTDIKPEDTSFEKRLKVGAEGAGLYGGIGTVGVGVVKGTGVVWKFVTELFGTEKIIRRKVAEAIATQTNNPKKAIEEIDKVLADFSGTDFKPTTGTISGDMALLGTEKGIKTKASSQAEFVQRFQENMRAMSDEIEKITTKYGGDSEKAKTFFETYTMKRLQGKEDALELAQKATKAIDDETENMVSEFAARGGKTKQADASLIIDDAVHSELNKLTLTKNNLYDAIDPGNMVSIPKSRLQSAVLDLAKKEGPADTTWSKIPKSLKESLNALFGPKSKPLKFGYLTDLRPDLSEAITAARNANQGGVVKRLVAFKQSIENETAILAQGEVPAALAARKANNYYIDEYVPKFKEGVGDLYRRAERRGKPFAPTSTGQQFLGRATGTTEAAKQLKAIVSGAESAVAAKGAVKDYLIANVADLMNISKSGKASKQVLEKYLNNRSIRETLAQFPDVNKEIQLFKSNLDKAVVKQGDFGLAVDAAKQNLRQTQKEMRVLAAKYFVDANPVKAMNRVLNSSDPAKAMEELATLAKSDPSGQALPGLRVALSQLLETPAVGLRGTREVGGSLEVLRNKVSKLLTNKGTREAISKLYSPSDMAILDRVQRGLNLLDRINIQVTTGSPTAHLGEAVQRGRILLAATWGIVKGKGIFMISRWLQNTLGINPVVKAEKLLADVMLDPELAKLMLSEATEVSKPHIAAKLTAYMLNNFNMTEGDVK